MSKSIRVPDPVHARLSAMAVERGAELDREVTLAQVLEEMIARQEILAEWKAEALAEWKAARS